MQQEFKVSENEHKAMQEIGKRVSVKDCGI
jgi:hypothetical protein